MTRTKKEIDRILQHMQKICQISEVMLAKLEAQDADLQMRENRILEALAGGDLCQQDRFIRNASTRLKSLAEERQGVIHAHRKVSREHSRQRQMLLSMEGRLSEMVIAHARQEDERMLGELIDRMFARCREDGRKGTQASRKAESLELS